MELEEGGRLSARAVAVATGPFARPYRAVPSDPKEFTGQVLHSADHHSPTPFTGRRMVGVGAGGSTVQIAAEPAGAARVRLATRGP